MEENQNSGPGSRKPQGGFKFNPYWIYGILFVVLLGLTFIRTGGSANTNWSEVRQMILQGDVEKLRVVNDREVQVYLTSAARQKEPYKKKINKQESILGDEDWDFAFEMEKDFFNTQFALVESEIQKTNKEAKSPVVVFHTDPQIWGQIF